MRIAIFDCYVDEPSCLGVPPFISPYPRLLAGAIEAAGHDWIYLTIDDWRKRTSRLKSLSSTNLLVFLAGAIVPGKYLRSMPASWKEILTIASGYDGTKFLAGPLARFHYTSAFHVPGLKLSALFEHVCKKDADATIYDYLTEKCISDRNRTIAEWQSWSLRGAGVVRAHPDFPQPLIVELETSRGCARYFTGGCSFCSEILYGKPQFRTEKNISDEVRLLSALGVTNFRLGAAACIFSYRAHRIGELERPVPNVTALKKLLGGIRNAAPGLKVLHTDNADPAVIATHPEEAREIAKLLVEYCTPGNVLAFGMESADPAVIKANNLNAEPDEVMRAITLINDIGAARGTNGMPRLLPGLNFLCGLKAETKTTYELNIEFLKDLLARKLMLRRINIRQVASVRTNFHPPKASLFKKFKYIVRTEIDRPMLERVVPRGTILRSLYTELRHGNQTFARQIGTYPLLVRLPYRTELGHFIDAAVLAHGYRSVDAVEYPLDINHAPLNALLSIPMIGRRRAATILRNRPFRSIEEMIKVLDETEPCTMNLWREMLIAR